MISGFIPYNIKLIIFINNVAPYCYFRTWESGFCHTYNPAEPQSPEFDQRIGLFLGHNYMNKDLRKLNFRKFWLYIHENGQFWPKADFEPITIRADEYKVLKFSISKEFKVTTLFYYKKNIFFTVYNFISAQ